MAVVERRGLLFTRQLWLLVTEGCCEQDCLLPLWSNSFLALVPGFFFLKQQINRFLCEVAAYREQSRGNECGASVSAVFTAQIKYLQLHLWCEMWLVLPSWRSLESQWNLLVVYSTFVPESKVTVMYTSTHQAQRQGGRGRLNGSLYISRLAPQKGIIFN